MLSLNVPVETPLTHASDALSLVAVFDTADEFYGNFPNRERALMYVRDWITHSQGDASVSSVGDTVYVNGSALFTLYDTTLRL